VSDNQITLVGNLTADPELRSTPNGLPVTSFRLAVSQRLWDGDGWKDGEPSFFRVNVWRDQAQHVNQSLRKGARCIVVGRLRSHSWETPDGERRSAVEVEADDVAASLRFAPVASAGSAATVQDNGWQAEAEAVAAGKAFDEVPF
jgi:single-strand DNA-binding protein